MIRRILISALIICMLLSSLPSEAAFFTDEQLKTLEKQMVTRCDEIFASVNHPEYLDGGCAEWVNDQLIHNNIGYWYKGNYSYGYDDGNKWFADLDEGAVTDTGYTQVKYPGDTAIQDLISVYAGLPVYNVVVSWQRGSGKWVAEGHVLYIWCIYDGYVYYTDTFNQQFGDAGHIVKRTVENFVELYDQISGPMLGAVHFAGDEIGGYHPDENIYSEYIALEGCLLRTSPTEVGEITEEELIPVPAGESISVRGAYTDDFGRRWLRVEGGKWIKDTEAVKNGNYSTIICESISIPQVWMVKHGFTMAGTITSHGGAFSYISVTIIDSEGNVVMGGERRAGDSVYSVAEMDETTHFEQLLPGMYRYRIEVENAIERAVIVDAEFEIRNSTRYRDEKYIEYSESHKMYTPLDANMSGKVDEGDLEMVHRAATYADDSYLSDVNGDGYINLTDMYLVNNEITKAPE